MGVIGGSTVLYSRCMHCAKYPRTIWTLPPYVPESTNPPYVKPPYVQYLCTVLCTVRAYLALHKPLPVSRRPSVAWLELFLDGVQKGSECRCFGMAAAGGLESRCMELDSNLASALQSSFDQYLLIHIRHVDKRSVEPSHHPDTVSSMYGVFEDR